MELSNGSYGKIGIVTSAINRLREGILIILALRLNTSPIRSFVNLDYMAH